MAEDQEGQTNGLKSGRGFHKKRASLAERMEQSEPGLKVKPNVLAIHRNNNWLIDKPFESELMKHEEIETRRLTFQQNDKPK